MASLDPLTGPLGLERAAHLLRRTTMGVTRAEIDTFAAMTATQAVNALLAPSGFAMPPDPLDPANGKTWVYGNDSSKNSTTGGSGDYLRHTYLTGWWLDEAFHNNNAPHIAQKLTFYYHTIFVVDHHAKRSENQFSQMHLFRQYINGSIKTLARKIIMDNSMIEYLDSSSSTKWYPNENFPREVLELFTIGKGEQIGPGDYTTYTEYDIQEAARLFTGIKQRNVWDDPNNKDPDTGIPRGYLHAGHHDTTNKTFSSAFNNTTITGGSNDAGIYAEFDAFINMVFSQIATAKNYVRKLYRLLVHSEITTEVENDIISPLATILYNNNYELLKIVEPLLKSKHFYDADDSNSNDEFIGAKILSPMEWFIKTMRFFKIDRPDEATNRYKHYHEFYRDTVLRFVLLEANMDLWSPPSVAGYKAYHQAPSFSKSWISANTLPFRYKFLDMLYTGQKLLTWGSIHVTFNPMNFVDDPSNVSDPRNAVTLVKEITDYAFPKPLDTTRFNYFLNDLLLDNLTQTNWSMEWDNYILTGNDNAVRPQIEKLIRGIVQSPEFQLG